MRAVIFRKESHPPGRPTFSIRCLRRRSKRTDVVALNGGLGGTETQTNVLVPSSSTLAGPGALGLDFGVLEDVRLLLESALRLDGQLGRPGGKQSARGGSSIDRMGIGAAQTDILNYPAPGRVS